MQTIVKILLSIAAIVSTLGCTREVEKSKLKLSFPASTTTSQKISSMAAGWGFADPSNISDIKCYAVMVGAEDLNSRSCVNAGGTEVARIGVMAGAFPAGSQAVIDVPSGPNRTVYVVGFAAADTSPCLDFAATGGPNRNLLSAPHIVSQKTLSLSAGTVELSMVASLTGAIPFSDCSFGSAAPTPVPSGTPTPTPPPIDAYIMSPAPGTYISAGVQSNVTLSGYCSHNSQIVDLNINSGAITGAPVCAANAWSLIVDVSSLSEGGWSACVSTTDGVTNSSPNCTPLQKDTIAYAPAISLSAPTTTSTTQTPLVNFSDPGDNIGIGVSGFHIDVGSSPGTEDIANDYPVGTPSVSVNGLSLSPGTYYVRVRTVDGVGNLSPYSNTASYDVIVPATLTITDGPTFDYGTQAVGSTMDHTFTITNSGGTNAASMSGSGIAAPFSFKGGSYPGTGGTCGSTLNSASNCTIIVSYNPASTGLQNDTIDIVYNDGSAPQTAHRDVAGTGASPALLLVNGGGTFEFWNQPFSVPVSKNIQIQNTGGVTATALSGTLSGDFSFYGGSFPGTGGTCGATLSASSICTIVVEYLTAAVGLDSVSLDIQYHNGAVGGNSANILVRGNGINPIGSWIGMAGGPPTARSNQSTIWTGTRMIVWGGTNGSSLNTGGIYDVNANSWSATSTVSAPVTRHDHTAIWTGRQMVVWGGWDGTSHLSSGGRYNPTSNTWAVTTGTGAPLPRREHTAVWNGKHMIIWGGTNGAVMGNGAKYDPAADTWTALPAPALSSRMGHAGVVLASKMVIWGGHNGAGTLYNDGQIYNPRTGTWGAMSSTNAPSPRRDFAYAASDSKFFIWGGHNGIVPLNDGAIYDINTDTWFSLSIPNAPAPASHARAIWTGSRFIVWGGTTPDGLGWTHLGSAHDPQTNTWEHFAIPGMSGRQMHSMVWTGTRAVIWGGRNASEFSDGQILDPIFPSVRILQVAAGDSHTCVLVEGGKVKCWGNNNYGQLGQGNTTIIGDDELPSSIPLVNLGAGKSAIQISVGLDFSCALLNTFDVLCWGNNTNNRLGFSGATIGDNELPGPAGNYILSNIKKIASGGQHTCALKTDNNIICWGYGITGQMGIGTTVATNLPATDVAALSGLAVDVASGSSHSCAILEDGSVKCWGENTAGELGDGTFTNRPSPAVATMLAGLSIQKLTLGYDFACGLAFDAVKCWGQNGYGQLGNGTVTSSTSPVNVIAGDATDIASGVGHTCAIANGIVHCWGQGTMGAPGQESTADVLTPEPLVTNAGNNKIIGSGDAHSCVVSDSGDLRCWGLNSDGQLGQGDTLNRGDSPTSMTMTPINL